jgi:hypothetical protein
MPKFEEENSLSAPDGGPVAEQLDAAEKTSENIVTENDGESARYSLKRGRMPASKKDSQKVADPSIPIGDVCNDAIGTRKNGTADMKKSTKVIDRNMKKPGNWSPCSAKKGCEVSATGDEKCACTEGHGQCEKRGCGFCRLIGRFFALFGLCKKKEQRERKPRQYRHRSNNQRKRHP